jgi:4-hydroxybenzoate polyprenyltransferase
MRRLLTVLEMIKFQHTIFALPFAAIGAFYAARGVPTTAQILWITAAMVAARTAAMVFNRIVDARHDAANPRTKDRAIPKGLVSVPFAWGVLAVSAGLFVLAAAMLNRTVLLLAPVALAVTLGYSLTKRFTTLCHFILGLSLAMAPIGAFLAVRPELDPFPLLMGAAVLFWVAGFDILYATQDVDFDRAARLKSVPAAVGVGRALAVARVCHALTVTALAAAIPVSGLGGWYTAGVAVIAMLLAYEHALVKEDDLARVNRAFFHVNAVVSVVLCAGGLADLFLRRG